MITLCGFSVSNYYNKVKLALLEKGIPFTEELQMTGSKDDAVLSCSPLGKIPYLRTEHGALCESQAMLDYIDAAHPANPLMPADAWGQAKVREMITFIDMHLELVARTLYPQAFFGSTVSDETKAQAHKLLVKNIAGFKRLAKFSPFVAGGTFTQADCAAWVSLPLVGSATKIALGEDLLLAAGIDWKAYAAMVGQRPAAIKVAADRKADQARMAELAKSR